MGCWRRNGETGREKIIEGARKEQRIIKNICKDNQKLKCMSHSDRFNIKLYSQYNPHTLYIFI